MYFFNVLQNMTFPDTKIMLRKAMLIKDSLLYLCCIGQLRVCSLKLSTACKRRFGVLRHNFHIRRYVVLYQAIRTRYRRCNSWNGSELSCNEHGWDSIPWMVICRDYAACRTYCSTCSLKSWSICAPDASNICGIL